MTTRRFNIGPVADSVPFDNSTNGFTSEDTQEAIEEVNTSLQNSASVSCQFTENGQAGENDYLKVGDTAGDDVGFLVPFDGTVAFFNASNDDDNNDKVLELVRRRPANDATNTVIATLTIPDTQFAANSTPNVAVLEGDELLVRVQNNSESLEDAICTVVVVKDTGGGGGPGSGSGEVNTASNLGTGEGTFSQKVGVDLQFKSLVAGTNITLSSDSDEITIASSGGGNAFSAGSVNGDGTTNSTVNANVTRNGVGDYSVAFVTPASNDDYIVLLTLEQNPGTDDYSISYDNVTVNGFDVDIREQDDGGSGGTPRDNGYSFLVPFTEGGTTPNGEANTASNLGTGEGVFAQKNGVDLEFKSLVEGSNITLSSTGTEVTITAPAPGEVNTASNLGAGSQVFAQKTAQNLEFRTLTSSGQVTLTQNADTINIDVPASAVDPDTNSVTQAVEVGGGQAVNSPVTITFDTTSLENTNIATHTPGGTDITIVKAGLYEIHGSLSIDHDGNNNNRTTSEMDIRVNGAIVPGGVSFAYHRTGAQGEDGHAKTLYVQLAATDVVTLTADRVSGTGNLSTVANTGVLSVKFLRSTN